MDIDMLVNKRNQIVALTTDEQERMMYLKSAPMTIHAAMSKTTSSYSSSPARNSKSSKSDKTGGTMSDKSSDPAVVAWAANAKCNIHYQQKGNRGHTNAECRFQKDARAGTHSTTELIKTLEQIKLQKSKDLAERTKSKAHKAHAVPYVSDITAAPTITAPSANAVNSTSSISMESDDTSSCKRKYESDDDIDGYYADAFAGQFKYDELQGSPLRS
jgi:hypothetical protein